MRTEPETWSPCGAGELQALGTKLQHQQRAQGQARFAKQALGGATAVALCMLVWAGWSSLMPGGISCFQCHSTFEQYAHHLADDAPMETTLATSMAEHFDGCAHCRELFVAEYPGLLTATTAKAGFAIGSLLLLVGHASRRRNKTPRSVLR